MSISKLESAAKGQPSYTNKKWDKVVEILDQIPVEKQAEAVEAFEAASTHWPQRVDGWSGLDGSPDYEVRRAPLHWVKEVYGGQHQPKHQTIRILTSPRRPLRGLKLPELVSPDAALGNVAQVTFEQVKLPGTFLKLMKGAGPWQRWRVLRLWYCELKAAQLKIIAKGDFDALESLVLTQNWIRADGAKALTKAPGLVGLKALELGLNGIGLEGAQHLAGADWLRAVERLSLEHNELTDEALATLSADGTLAAVEALHLANNPLGADPAQWMGNLPAVRSLDLEGTAITETSFGAICDHFAGLTSLKVSKTSFNDACARRLIASGAKLDSLDITETQLSPEGVTALLEAPGCQSITRLSFGRGFTPAHIKALADGALPKLKWLWWTGVEDSAGVTEAVKASPRLLKAYPYTL